MTVETTLLLGWPRAAAERPAGAWIRPLAAGLLAGALLGSSATAVLSWAADRPVAPEVAARTWPERPLPREWRWSPPGVDADVMFRKLSRPEFSR